MTNTALGYFHSLPLWSIARKLFTETTRQMRVRHWRPFVTDPSYYEYYWKADTMSLPRRLEILAGIRLPMTFFPECVRLVIPSRKAIPFKPQPCLPCPQDRYYPL